MNFSSSRARIHDAYKSVFDNPNGDIVLTHLAKKFGITKPTAVDNNPYMTYMHEGERRVVLSILRELKRDDATVLGLTQQGIQEEMENDRYVTEQ